MRSSFLLSRGKALKRNGREVMLMSRARRAAKNLVALVAITKEGP